MLVFTGQNHGLSGQAERLAGQLILSLIQSSIPDNFPNCNVLASNLSFQARLFNTILGIRIRIMPRAHATAACAAWPRAYEYDIIAKKV